MASRSCHGIPCSFLESPAFSGSLRMINVRLCENLLSTGLLRRSAHLWSPEVAGTRGIIRRRYAAADGWEKEFWLGSECDLEDEQGVLVRDASSACDGSPSSDWAAQARDRALQVLQARDPSFKSLSSLRPKKSKRSRVRKEVDSVSPGRRHVGSFCWPVEEEAPKSSSQEHENQHDAERLLNRQLIQAVDCQQILDIVSNTRLSHGLQLITPINAATALHRIARQMEKVSMPRNERLAFARQQEMRQLVSLAVCRVRFCNAQGISNIAWALAKVGGTHLYGDEMNEVGSAALAVLEDLQPQHIANLAGAYATMRLANPLLFESLARRASVVANKLQPQELAQVLWAFASLFHSATPLFDALDRSCEGPVASKPDTVQHAGNISHGDVTKEVDMYEGWKLEHLAMIAWSYSVLRELHRPSFAKIWARFCNAGHSQDIYSKYLTSSRFLSQLYQVKLTVDLEYPGLHVPLANYLVELTSGAWNTQKQQLLLTSTLQREIQQLVVGTGFQFMPEYTAAYYSVDFALPERKIAVEVDGPSHFTRNTGTPLGHTILKTRHLEAAGWKVVSVPYHELDKLQGEKNHVTFIRELLQGCL